MKTQRERCILTSGYKYIFTSMHICTDSPEKKSWAFYTTKNKNCFHSCSDALIWYWVFTEDKCLVNYSWSVPIKGMKSSQLKKKNLMTLLCYIKHKIPSCSLFFCDTIKLEKYYSSCLRDLPLKWTAEQVQTI